MKLITSESNPQFRRWLELKTSSGIKEHGLYLLSGQKIVPEILTTRLQDVASVVLTEKSTWPDSWPERERIERERVFYQLPHALFKELDEVGTHLPLLVMKLPLIGQADLQTIPQARELILALQDPANVGAMIRVALAFGIERVILLQECANPFLPKSVKSSSGSVCQMNFAKGPSIAQLTPTEHLITLDSSGDNIAQFQWPKTFRLLIGEEGRGVPAHLKTSKLVSIPIEPAVESLNAVTAGAIALYQSAATKSRPAGG